MFSGLQRWLQTIPAWVKALPLAAILAGLSLLYQSLTGEDSAWTGIVRHLFFLVLLLASLLLGMKGGLVCAALISLNFLPGLASSSAPGLSFPLDAGLVIVLYFLTGFITGTLADNKRREGERRKTDQDLAKLGTAAAAVAHELKSPLVAIGGFAQRMFRDLPPGHPHRDKLGIIVEQAGHMEHLLREMLDFSRPLRLKLRSWDLNRLVGDVIELLSGRARQKGVRLEFYLAPDLDELLLDGARIKQVLTNLLENALHATEKGGRVRVTTVEAGLFVTVNIMDNGCGIEKDHRESIFSPFFTTKRRGTGLGLAISNKIVSAHQGALEVESDLSQGSTFRLHLPAYKGK